MDQHNYTTKTRKNKHLSSIERGQIEAHLKENRSAYWISKELKRALNTILNEIKRGTVLQIKNEKEINKYYAESGQIDYERKRRNSRKSYKYFEVQEFIKYCLEKFQKEGYSLDSAVGRCQKEGLFSKEKQVCTKTLYNYAHKGLLGVKPHDFPMLLRLSSSKKQKKHYKRLLGRSISERSPEVMERKEFGHWEIDLMLGKKRKGEEVLLTLTERKTRYEIIHILLGKESKYVNAALKKLFQESGDFYTDIFKSITSDNGLEFSKLMTLEKEGEKRFYYAHPYSSFERGTNERHNGLIRRFIPKGKSINSYSLEHIMNVEKWCNDLPRKILNYSTPREAFQKEIELLKEKQRFLKKIV